MPPADPNLPDRGDSSGHPGALLPQGGAVYITEPTPGHWRVTLHSADRALRVWHRRTLQAAMLCQAEIEAGRVPPQAGDWPVDPADPHPAPRPVTPLFRDLSADLAGLAARAAEGAE